MSLNLVHQINKEILTLENNYNYKIIQEDEKSFNTIELTMTIEDLINLSKKYNSKNGDYVLLTLFNNEWCYFEGYPSLILDNNNVLVNALKNANTTKDFSNEVTFSLLRVQSKIYAFNNRKDFYNYLTFKKDIIFQLNNSGSLFNLISHGKSLPIIFFKEENLWLDQNWIDKNNSSSGMNTEILMFILKYKINKQLYLSEKKEIEEKFLEKIEKSYNRVLDLNLVVQDTIIEITHTI